MTNSWSAGWATGDIPTAAEFAKGIGAIYNTTLGAAAASVDVSGIIAGYAHLLIVVYARGDTAAGTVNLFMRFNNDSGANYDRQNIAGVAASPASAEQFAQTSAHTGTIPAASATADVFGGTMILVPHYAGALDNKCAISLGGAKSGTTTGLLRVESHADFWRSSAAINRVTLFASAGNLDAGSRVTIYGMGA